MYLFLIRGLPGSGKDTLAGRLMGTSKDSLAPERVVVHSADDFFLEARRVHKGVFHKFSGDLVYNFDPKKLPQAHKACQEDCSGTLDAGRSVAVCNTFSCRWELQPYLDMAKRYDATLIVMDLFDAGLTDEELAERNTHGVPVESIAAMRRRWESEWTMYSPLPPKPEEYGPLCDPGECDECDDSEVDGRELVKEAANLLRQAPDEVKRDWLEGFIEVYTDDEEEVPPLIELVDAWEENQFDSLGYDFAVKEVMETIDWIKRDIETHTKKRGEKNAEDNED